MLLGLIGPVAKDAAPELVKLLEDAAPELVKLLEDPDWRVRRAATEALGRLRAVAKGVIPDLAERLKDPDWRVRQAAAEALGGFGPAGQNAAPELAKLLKDPEANVRGSAAMALGQIGPAAKDAAPELAKLLKDRDVEMRAVAARTLGQIGPAAKDAAPELVKLMNDPAGGVRWAAAEALRGIGAAAKDAAPELVKLLKDPEASVRGAAAMALGQIGPAEDAVPELAKLLKDPDWRVRKAAVEALTSIAGELTDKNVPNAAARRHLDDVLKSLDKLGALGSGGDGLRVPVRRAINHLEALELASLPNPASRWLQAVSFKDWKTWAVILPACWLLVLFGVLLVKPLWLLRWNEALKDSLPTIKELSLGIPVGYLSLIGLMAYRPRVLNAWVKAHLERARESFDELPTAKDRKVHVPSPVKVNGQLAPEFSGATLRSHVGRAGHQCRWLIVGEGGAGKTSLACQMARWAMARDKAHRLAPHLMLPVLIEDELDDSATPVGLPRLTEAIRGKLQALIGSTEPISPELLKYLLRRWRVLVVIDHFTELSQATRDQIRLDSAEFPAAALVVTARTDALGNHPKHTVEPMRIEGKRLSMFIDAYLSERRKRDLFDDEEYFEACLQLSRMVGERDITVLLAKLYADQMVAAKESPAGDELPKTVPDLILRYLNELNRNTGGEDNRAVQRDGKAIAWECLKASYRPGPAERTAVIGALKDDGEDERAVEARLDYLVNRLRVIQVTGAAEDRIRFVLDPLAEYLAGLQVVEENQGRGTRQKWERFLREADRMPGAPEAIRGFLLAVRDCCLASRSEVPEFVLEELSKRGGLDPELVQRLQLKQRVRLYINNLDSPHADDRRHAAKTLGELGAAAKDAVPKLVKLLKDPEAGVRRAAASALGRIMPAAKDAVPALVKLLEDPEAAVRRAAADSLGRIGPAAEDAIPELTRLLEDHEAGVRGDAAEALGRLGPAAVVAVPELVKLLKDPEAGVRGNAASALWELGPAAEAFAPELAKLLKDPDGGVRWAAARTLGGLGPAAEAFAPELARLLEDPDEGVRRAAAHALGGIGPAGQNAAPELVEKTQ